MCGLAGWAGIPLQIRADLTEVLGWGIDDRGGHAAGWVSQTVVDGKVSHQVGRKLGRWTLSKPKFIRRASAGDVCVMHARYATCGSAADINNAHPFTVMRPNRTLYGAHNGMISDTDETAKSRNRKHTVDSRELFELLADGENHTIAGLPGYGVVTWCESDVPGVFLSKMTDSGYIVVAELACGGIVWASTWRILEESLTLCDLDYAHWYKLETGTVYHILPNGKILVTERPKITLASRWSKMYSYGEFTWRDSEPTLPITESDRRRTETSDDKFYEALMKDWLDQEEEKERIQAEERASRVRATWDELARDPFGVDEGT